MNVLQAFVIFSLLMLCNYAVAENHTNESSIETSSETVDTDTETQTGTGSNEEYKEVFKTNFAKTCMDGDQSELALELCDCMSDELIRTRSVPELLDITEYDEKVVMLNCLQKTAP